MHGWGPFGGKERSRSRDIAVSQTVSLLLVVFLGGYLIGSVPFGLILSRLAVTARLAAVSLIIGIGLALPLGVLAAIRPGIPSQASIRIIAASISQARAPIWPPMIRALKKYSSLWITTR